MTSWNPYWDKMLEDRSIPLRKRLIDYYVEYSHRVLTYEWVRIFLFAGLRGEDLTERFVEFVKEHVSTRVIKEIRADQGLSTEKDYKISDFEFELISGIHADIFYLSVRKWVYGMTFPENLDPIIEAKVVAWFDGVKVALDQYVEE